MIDVNKIRNNYQKFSVIKQKCDPVVSKQQQSNQKHQHNQSQPNPKLSSVIPKELTSKAKTVNASSKNSKNPVRAANQHFFLIPSYQDQNFLREECELAHAQVISTNFKDNSAKKADNHSNNNNSTIRNNKVSSKSQLSRSAPAALPLANTMRSSAHGTSTVSNLAGCNGSLGASANKLDLSMKILPKTAKNSQNTLNHRQTISQVRSSVHRTIPSTAVASSTLTETKATSNFNNNYQKEFLNNNMQQSSNLTDHEDIKFIDCDDTIGSTNPNNPGDSLNATAESRCIMPQISHQTSSGLAKAKVRPKSTILTSSNNLVFEKINNYKYENGSSSLLQNNDGLHNSTVGGKTGHLAASGNRNDSKPSGIDSKSIKASIEKFNNFSEQKRLPPLSSTVIMRSNANSGSINSLQHHRHSTELDNCNNRLSNTTNCGGSLTRSPYRSAANATSASATAKVLSSMQSIASTVSPTTANVGAITNTNSLPLKNNKNYDVLRKSEYTTGSLSKDIRTQAVLNAKGAASKHLERDNGPAEESIRDTVRSTLPPSPTSTKYWERDPTRYSTLITYNDTETTNKSSHNEKNEGLCGLRNIGNTCFMNSVIQCLSHTQELTRFLRNYNSMRTTSKDQHILNEFAKLIRDMWSGSTNSVTPSDLKRAFSAKHRMYSDYNQQDAQEFLRFFLDSLHSALNTGVKGEVLRIDDHLSDNAKAELTWDWYSRIENSLIRDLFVGQLKSTLRCTTCGNTSVTFDPFWDLSVSLPTSSRCKLDACLDLFIREEVLDGDEMPTCSKCKQRRKCTKSFSIQRFPKYLVIHLKRFSEARWSKLTNIVEFPTGERELNMGPYGSNSTSNIYYSLYGVSNHMGSTAGGHYVAVCKHPVSKKWHEFNDNIVSGTIPESHIVSSSAYILFYERS